MFRTVLVVPFTAALLGAQPVSTGALAVEVLTDAARCEEISPNSVCLRYTAPASAGEFAGVFEPGVARLRITGPAAPARVDTAAISPVGRSWLGVRFANVASGGGTSVSGQLPMEVEIFADETQLAEIKAGRLAGMVSVTLGGATSPLKMPVQLAVTAPTDALRAEPDSLPELTVTASPNGQPARFNINVTRNDAEPPVHVSVTPETSDGGVWLSADLRLGAAQCADLPAPCSFDAVIRAPQRAGTYWGVLVITGDGFADRVAVRLTVQGAPRVTPVTVEPRQISLSARHGSSAFVAAGVKLAGGGRDGVSYRATYSDKWLSVDPAVGTWPAALRIIMTPHGLEPGVYTDTVVLRTLDTNEVLATIPVRFNVIAPSYAPAVLDGGGWRTRFYLVNPSPVETKATLRFWKAGASAWPLGIGNRGLVTAVENEPIPAGGMRVIETQGTQARRQQGWAELTADGPVAMHAMLSEAKRVSRWLPVDATIPMMNPYRDHILLPFDNLDGASASVSLSNPGDDPLTVDVAALNENGAEIAKEGKFTLAGHEAATYTIAQKWRSASGRRGLISLRFDGERLFAVGLRSSGKGFHSYPAVACAETGVDRALPMVNTGGLWQSTAYLANTTSTGQLGLLRLWPDKSRFAGQTLADESAPVIPGNGMLVWQAPGKDSSRAAGGWLESRYSKQVNGFMLLRQSYSGTPAVGAVVERYESALGAQRGSTGRLAIPYDNRGSNATQIVLINASDSPADIQTVIYDLAGRFPRFADSFRLPARGQLVVNSADRWELGQSQGILEFSNRAGVPLTGVGLRFSEGAMAVLPAYEK